MSRHADRQALARDVRRDRHRRAERGDDGVARVEELLGGIGADAVLECVGTKESMQQALDATRPGGRVGYVGVPAGGSELPIRQLFSGNVSVGGGVAPVRGYIPELLDDVLVRRHRPGPGVRPASCRSSRRLRPTPRWTSAARSRRCCRP